MLKLDQLTFRYPGSNLDFEFTLEAVRGDIIGIMGASGSGKSTLLELVAGFLKPLSGTLTWDGNDLVSMRPGLRPVTVLFQNHNLFEHLTAARNIALGLDPRNRLAEADWQRVKEALAKTGLEGRGNQLASTLSGGQQQRVALARAFVRSQPIVLLDEPFSGLDEETRASIMPLVKALAKEENKCVLMVTHDRDECEALATEVHHVERGRISGSR